MTLKPNHRVDPEKQSIKPSTPQEEEEDGEQDTLNVSPCYLCSKIRVCGEGHIVSPLNCQKMNRWLEKKQGD